MDQRHASDANRARLRELAPGLKPQALEVLTTMYSSAVLQGTTGSYEVGKTLIAMEQGAELHKLLRREAVKDSLEIGFACGFSTVWILDALPDDGSHMALDPFEERNYGGVGLSQVRALGPAARFDWVPDLSIHVLSAAIKARRTFDFIFIDGNHRFDDVLVDFYLADQALKRNGIVAFDDLWMPSVQTVADFVRTNRRYELLAQPVGNMRVFRKLADDSRPWDHFANFTVGQR
jgi:predicted O-methyltransferase YrrM